jgi:hypothetical protein
MAKLNFVTARIKADRNVFFRVSQRCEDLAKKFQSSI